MSCGREGPALLIVRLPGLRDEALKIADLLAAAHQKGHAWGDMAVLCRRHSVMFECANVLRARGLPHQVRERSGDFAPLANSIKVMTMHASKGVESPVVAVPGVGQMPGEGEEVGDEARLFYVAATRATQRLVVTVSGEGDFAHALFPQQSWRRNAHLRGLPTFLPAVANSGGAARSRIAAKRP